MYYDIVKSFAVEDNRAKSQHGLKFEIAIEKTLKVAGVIYKKQPRYGGQFNPDFEIQDSKNLIIVDCTTTARSDRLKQKQFDAHGIKAILNSKSVKFIVVVKNTEEREKAHFLRAKQRIKEWKLRKKINYIDGILSFNEFKSYIQNNYDIEDI